MKKLFASVGLVALGAASAQAQYAPGLTPLEMSKAWSLSAELRGFYDDNYLTLPKGLRESSFGAEIAPSIAVNHSTSDTLLSASYLYDARWYEKHSVFDQSHQFNGRFEHEFSDRFKLSLNESFVVAQEPDVIDNGVVAASPLRIEGNNVRNTGSADFTVNLTKLLDLHMGYANTVYAYQQHAKDVIGYPFATGLSGAFPGGSSILSPNTVGFQPSRSAALDRMEQLATLDLRWKAMEDTTGVFGYQFEHVDYTSPEYIILPGTTGAPAAGFKSNVRNENDHFAFLGVDHSFTPNLNASLRVGAEYVDYYQPQVKTTRLSPYADANVTWQYTAMSSAQLGVKHIHNSTDVTGFTAPVLDEDATVVYASLMHKITDQFTVNAMGQAQYSTFNGGDYPGEGGISGKSENFYVAGVNLAYHFNPWFMTEAGYNYSKLNSELAGRSYTRNMVYIGVRATY